MLGRFWKILYWHRRGLAVFKALFVEVNVRVALEKLSLFLHISGWRPDWRLQSLGASF